LESPWGGCRTEIPGGRKDQAGRLRAMLSAIIITYNEEARIRRCLTSLVWVDEIIIVDSGSTDSTISICREYTDLVFIRPFDNFARQKNYGVEKANYDWILSIDADEVVSSELRAEIERLLHAPEHDAYYVARNEYIFGKVVGYWPWHPTYLIRLFRKEKGYWVGDVHEGVKVDGTVGKLRNRLDHLSHETIADFITKLNTYTSIEAKTRVEAGCKPRVWKILVAPSVSFFVSYFFYGAWTNGAHGFLLAALVAIYTFVKHAKIWDLYFRDAPSTPKSHRSPYCSRVSSKTTDGIKT
jgi:glycosyltransferase involved in cell wall biosynthesis